MSGVSAGAQPAVTPAPDPYGILVKPIPDKTVVLSFDDACVSQATFVAPLLKNCGFGATFYITEAMGFKSRKDWYMTWDQIKAVQDMGFEIGNHTVNHWGLSAHNVDNCIKTTAGIEEQFRKHGIARPTTFCWPMYRVNNAFVATLSERGYLFARGGHERVYDPRNDCPMDVPSFTMKDDVLKKNPDAFRQAARQAKDGKVAVFCFHGVPDGEHPQVGLEPDTFREMMSFLRENHYNVISMRDLARYIDPAKAALYLSRPLAYPWGGRALAWGWVTRKADTLYIGIDKLPADRKLPLPGLTTPIAKAWFLADADKPPCRSRSPTGASRRLPCPSTRPTPTARAP